MSWEKHSRKESACSPRDGGAEYILPGRESFLLWSAGVQCIFSQHLLVPVLLRSSKCPLSHHKLCWISNISSQFFHAGKLRPDSKQNSSNVHLYWRCQKHHSEQGRKALFQGPFPARSCSAAQFGCLCQGQ